MGLGLPVGRVQGPKPAATALAFKSPAAARKSSNVVLNDPRLLYRLLVSDRCAETFGPGPLNSDNWPLLEFSAPRQKHRGRSSAGEVIEQLLRQRSLPESARTYMDTPAGSVDAQIEFAEFALSIYEPFEGMFDPSKATEIQSARYSRLLEASISMRP